MWTLSGHQGRNPNTTPNDGFAEGTSILSGEWKLIFTNALDVLSLGLLPGVEVGQIFQNISPDGTEVRQLRLVRSGARRMGGDNLFLGFSLMPCCTDRRRVPTGHRPVPRVQGVRKPSSKPNWSRLNFSYTSDLSP